MERAPGLQISKIKNPYTEIFFIAFFTALSFLLPYIILDRGLFLFFGDYCVQQVPFYSLAHDAIRSGNIWWNWNTDLGANFIGSYAFYLLGSPFFWLTLLLPSAAVPYTLGPLLALKMSFAALFAFIYIKRFVKKNEIAALCALLYAFSGYSIYNIFFNHFHEPMCFFPLLLIALEEYMANDRKGVFAAAVFLNALVNYNFFVGEVIFTAVYWVIRLVSGGWNISVRKYLLLAFEAVTGFGMSMVLVLPAVLAITSNPRTSDLLSGWNLLTYNWPQRYFDIIHSAFFPQDLPSRPNFFPDSNAKWSSVAAWLPMFSMSGALAYIGARRGSWLKRILCVSFVLALVPGLNAVFVLFNDAYYARWFYMPVLMLALATAVALESPDIDFSKGLRWTTGITLAFVAAIGLIPNFDSNKKFKGIGLEAYPSRFWVYTAIVLAGLIAVMLLIRRYGKDSVNFINAATVTLIFIVCIYGNYFVATGKTYGWDGRWFKSVMVNGASKIHLDQSGFYRIDTYDGIDNEGMFWHIPTIQAFHSVVPASVMNFYPTVGVTRDVASRPDTAYAGLRPFLSVKYLFDSQGLKSPPMPGWVRYGTQLGFTVWKNQNYIPMGFTYSNYVTAKRYDDTEAKDRLLLKAIVLNDSQIAKYSDILTPLAENSDFSDASMAEDSAERRKETCSSFHTDNKGFSASINLAAKNLVFFSVPYDSGWTATVNGKPAQIEKVDIGFMAVECPPGTSRIRFSYTTPGLYRGAAVSGVSLAVLAVYLGVYRSMKKRRNKVPLSASTDIPTNMK